MALILRNHYLWLKQIVQFLNRYWVTLVFQSLYILFEMLTLVIGNNILFVSTCISKSSFRINITSEVLLIHYFFSFFSEIFGQFSFLGFWFWCSSSSFCQSSFDGAQPFKDTWFSYLGVNLNWYQFLENLFISQSTNYLFVVNCFFPLFLSFLLSLPLFLSPSLSLSLSNCLVQSTISYFKSCLCFIASSVFFSWIFLLQSQI